MPRPIRRQSAKGRLRSSEPGIRRSDFSQASAYRRSPVHTMSISRLPQAEHTNRARHARTGVSAPYQRACSVESGSLRWPHALHHTTNLTRAAAALPKVIGGPE